MLSVFHLFLFINVIKNNAAETVFRKLHAPNKTNTVTKAIIVGLLNPRILKNVQDKYYDDTFPDLISENFEV